MSVHYCPRCNQRYMVGFDVSDYIHECNSQNLVLDEEDVVVIGDWEDYTGSGTKPSGQVMKQGSENEFQGARAGVEGERKQELTRRGARASTRRQRQHLEFIKIKNDKK